MRIISNEDARRLQEMWEWYSRERGRSRAERSLPLPSIQAPEVYVVKPQSAGGIPGLVNPDDPGSDDCDVYQFDSTDDLAAVSGFDKTVFNISESDIGQDWALAVREKYGKWIGIPLSRDFVIGKLDGALSQGGSATLSVWAGSTLADTGTNLTVYDWFLAAGESLDATTKVAAKKYHGKWYVIAAECPA